MRIEFAHAVHPPLSWSGTPLRIGRAADNDVSLPGAGVADHHVVLSRDARGLVLEVCAGAGRVYVNARPVREKALLRCGDSLGIGECRLHLVAEAATAADADASAGGAAVRALRMVAGPLSGRVYALDETLVLDDHGPAATSRSKGRLVLEPRGRYVRLDAGGLPSSRTVSVNGRDARQALLDDGDQVVMGTLRFVLDISADAPLPPASARPEPTPDDDAADGRRARHPEMWWLIVTAAVLALVLAGALFVHF